MQIFAPIGDDGKRWYSGGRFSDVLAKREEGVQISSLIGHFGVGKCLPRVSTRVFKSMAGAILWTHLGEKRVPRVGF